MSASMHPFEPSVAGMTCQTIIYPEWTRCGEGPDAQIHTGTRPAPPELEFPYPPCSLCDENTYHDGDGFCCDPCGAYWGNTGPGSWMEPDLKVCGATRKPFDRPSLKPENESIRHYIDYCIREDGHDGNHRVDSLSEWAQA